MGLPRIELLVVAGALCAAPAAAQTIPVPGCLHGESETPVQTQRREDALDTADLINRALDRSRRDGSYPTWKSLAASPTIASLQRLSGRQGELARRIEWGSDQPLPGWRLHFVAAQDSYAFSLTDTRDPCQFTVVSNDTSVILEARPEQRRGQFRVIPLDSSQ